MASQIISRSALLEQFACIGDACPDTCCKGWGMQVDAPTKARYEAAAPELLSAVHSGEAEWVMKRDPATDYCVKFEGGWCGIQKQYGTDFLSDACHFFPRVTRQLGGRAVMTAALSCPEAARLALGRDGVFGMRDTVIERLPHALKDYAVPGLGAADALAVHAAFLQMAEDITAAPERIMAKLSCVARALQTIDTASWLQAAAFYLKHADGRLPVPEPAAADPFNVLHALMGLVVAAKKTSQPRLMQTIGEMERALKVTLYWDKASITATEESAEAYRNLARQWEEEHAIYFAPVLRRWIAAQLSLALFPFAGFGNTLTERVTIIGVRFATVKLALMCACAAGTRIGEAETVRVVQSLSRFMDHLADPTLSMQVYSETGWVREPRLRALIGDR